MGFLDGILDNMMGRMPAGEPSQRGNDSPLIQMALSILQRNGGIEGLLVKLQQAGLGQQAQSWIGKGQNMPVSADALSQIFGRGQLGQIAQQYGIPTD